MTKRTIFTALAVLFIVTFCAAPAVACPASYVRDQAAHVEGTVLQNKFHSISDSYLTTKGVDPDSSEGKFIQPYVLGTTWVDHLWNIHRIDKKSVAQCVQDSLGCWHHNQHFGDGQRIYKITGPPRKANVLGG